MPSGKAVPGHATPTAPAAGDRARIKVQVYLDDEIALGPGKRQLLELIERHGSISAAARAMGLSYRRAWLMVDTMNRCFQEPLVHAGKGGAHGGGATLTPFGQAIRDRFASLEATLAATAAADLAHLRQLLRRKDAP
jgi:molybdate transport system regulatory protein